MEIVLAEREKMKPPKGVYVDKKKPMLTKLGFADGIKCKWTVDCSPRLKLLNRLGAGSGRISGITMREVEKLSG